MTAQVTYAYAVLPPDGPAEGAGPGIQDAPVHVLRGSRVALAVSEVDDAWSRWDPAATDPQELALLATRHFDVVGRLFRGGPVLPLRLGTVSSTPEVALAAVEARADELAAALRRVTGTAQWNVRVRPSARVEDGERPTSGTEYLTRLRDRRDRLAEERVASRASARTLLEGAADLALETDGVADQQELLSAAFLVPEQDADRFRRYFDDAEASGADVEILGPLPPYSFVPRMSEAS